MQTFLPFADYVASASVLDDARLRKQRVENLQIAQALTCRKLITSTKGIGPRGGKVTIQLPQSEWTIEHRTVGWQHHPATKMWTWALFHLLEYQTAICNEWTARGGKNDTCLAKTEMIYLDAVNYMETTATPRWFGVEGFHESHRSNLLRKDPEWYGQFGWTEPDNLEYVWP